MNVSLMERPAATEYAEFYETYVGRVPAGNVCDVMESEIGAVSKLLAGIDESQAGFRYAPGKWSIKGVVGHVIDCERVFAYRAMRFARNDPQALPGIDQDVFADGADYDRRVLSELAEEFDLLRRSHLHLFRNFGPEALMRRGTASGCDFTVRAVLYIVAGHQIHHMKVLREKYLPQL